MARAFAIAAVAAVGLVVGGCGRKEVVVRPVEGAGAAPAAAVDPPRGWRVHTDAGLGLSVALPRSWDVRRAAGGLRAEDGAGTLAASFHADRSAAGRDTPAGEYALATLAALPGYRDLEGRAARAPGSPYETARAEGTGTRERGGRRQRVSVTVLRLPGEVTLTAVAFSDPAARPARRTLDRALETLRAAQRSGRSG